MVAGLKEVDETVAHPIDKAISGGDASGPDIGTEVLQGFRLPNPLERFAPDLLHEPENLEGDLSIGPNPMLQVFLTFVLNDGDSAFGTGGTLLSLLGGHQGLGSLGEA